MRYETFHTCSCIHNFHYLLIVLFWQSVQDVALYPGAMDSKLVADQSENDEVRVIPRRLKVLRAQKVQGTKARLVCV